jgi:uncharacterized surface protein with fasciclin (FAS1) repeats
MLNWIRTLALVATTSFLAACGGDDHPTTTLSVAQGDPRFSILTEAVNAAGLADTLAGPGPLTVFAPTNDAFAALLTELGITKEALLANKPLLTAVLTYHVVSGRVLKDQVPVNTPIATLQGASFTVGGDLRITDGRGRQAAIVATDILCSNGVVHLIDRVILPPA